MKVSMTREEAINRIEDHMAAHHIGEYPHIKLKEALDLIGGIAQAVLYVHNVDLRRITMSITEFKIPTCFVRVAWLP